MSDDPAGEEPQAQPLLDRSEALLASAEDLAGRIGSASAILDDLNRRLTEVDPLLKAAESAATRFDELRTAAAADAQTIASHTATATTGLGVIEDLRARAQREFEEATKAKTEPVQALESAKAQGAAAQLEKESANVNSSFVQTVRGQVEAAAGAIDISRSKIADYETACLKSSETAKGIADIAAAAEARVTKYESELDQLSKEAAERHDALLLKIQALLPGATSAGLAAAFSERDQQLVASQRRWAFIFAGALAILGLVAGVVTGLIAWSQVAAGPGPDARWQEQAIHLFRRLLFVGPALWFAIFANRRYNALERLEEDYAHKVAMSKSFEGYKRELQGIGDAEKVLSKHAESLIEVLRRPPGQLYDNARTSDTPLETGADTGLKMLDSLKELLAKVRP